MIRALPAVAILVLGCAPVLPGPDVSALTGRVPTAIGFCGSVITESAIVTAAHCAPEWPHPDPLSDVAILPMQTTERAAAVRPGGPRPGERVWITTPRAEGWATCERTSIEWRAAILDWPAERGDSGGSAWSADGRLLCILTGAVAGPKAFCELP